MRLNMPLANYRALRHLARKSRCRVRIVDKRGWPFLCRRLRGRQMLLLGGLFFLLVIYLLSGFIWLVEVKPQNGPLRQVQPDEIIAAARAEGIKPGAYKHNLDIRALEFALEKRLPQLAWVGISLHGTRATINVVEKAKPPREEAFDQPASIVAAKDGVIKEILVINGEKRVNPGDTVRAGEILISGLLISQVPELEPGQTGVSLPPASQTRLVRARGIVRARVWYEKELELNCRQVREMPTGQKQVTVVLQTPAKSIVLIGPARPPYKYYRQESQLIALPSWRNYIVPVELEIITYNEIQRWQQQLSYEEAVKIAANHALLELKAGLPAGVSINEQKITPLSKPGAETVRVRVWLEVEEDIGEVVSLSGTS
jgi:similar to stage IV sporulation protein